MAKSDQTVNNEDSLSSHEQFLMEETTCCLCGHDLHFVHEIDFMKLKVDENVACPKCKIVLRQREYILQ